MKYITLLVLVILAGCASSTTTSLPLYLMAAKVAALIVLEQREHDNDKRPEASPEAVEESH